MPRITRPKTSRRTLGYYMAQVQVGALDDLYYMAIDEISGKVGNKQVLEYEAQVLLMSDFHLGYSRRKWVVGFSSDRWGLSLEDIVRRMSTPEALQDMPYPLWKHGLDWQPVELPGNWVQMQARNTARFEDNGRRFEWELGL